MNTLQWVTQTVREHNVKSMAEIGVLIGQLAEGVVTEFDMDRYVMVEKEINPKLLEMFQRNKEKPLALFAMPSVEAADLIADGSLDMVYIDADHSYEEVRKDILKWVPKVKMGGVVSGHDYNPNGGFGVHRAVDELINDFNLQPDDASVDNNIWWTIRNEGTLNKMADVIKDDPAAPSRSRLKTMVVTDFKHKKLVEYLEPGMKVLIRFGHGWGDTQMFMPAFSQLCQLYPEVHFDLYVECGQEEIFKSYPSKDSTEHDIVFSLDFPMAEGSDMTKTAKCCIEELGIQPPAQEFPILRSQPNPIVLVHFQGTALPGSVNCPEGVAQQIWGEILEAGFIPMECHFEHVFHNPINAKYGFVENNVRKVVPKLSTLIGLMQYSRAFVGVASGPFVTALCTMLPDQVMYLEKHHPLGTYTKKDVPKADIKNYQPGTVKQWLESLR